MSCAESPIASVQETVRPRIVRIEPAAGVPPVIVSIKGENLGRNSADVVQVLVGDVDCTSVVWINDAEIQCTIPRGKPGMHPVAITTESAGTSVASVQFEIGGVCVCVMV
jgi:hypothetical protein